MRAFTSQPALYNQKRSELRNQASQCLAAFTAQHPDAVAVVGATYTDTEGLQWLDEKKSMVRPALGSGRPVLASRLCGIHRASCTDGR